MYKNLIVLPGCITAILATRTLLVILTLVIPTLVLAQPPGVARSSNGNLYIANIAQLLDSCPDSDPALTQIRNDFVLYRNNTQVGNVMCNTPVSSMLLSEYSDELIALQALRTLYYMDMGRSNYLPWTQARLYDWLKGQINGIHIRDNSGAYCCELMDGKLVFVVGALNDISRDMDKRWEGISSTIALYAHEARHTQGYSHTSCCGIPGGCDQTYTESALSPYGIQWWLNTAWLTGTINLGLSCLSSQQQQSILNWHLGSNNSGYINRFCDDSPPFVPTPSVLGGTCQQQIPTWQENVAYALHQPVIYNGNLFEARMAHTSQSSWPPTLTPSLWQHPTPEDGSEWSTQTHYPLGSKVRFHQQLYQARVDHVSEVQWQPDQVPNLWMLIE